MATLRKYDCPQCGFTIMTEPSGHEILFSGEYDLCLCSDCRTVVSIRTAPDAEPFVCPNCGGTHLTRWNPVSGLCPACGHRLKQDRTAGIIMAD